ncbi:MAG: hypothetical protein ACLUKQ_03620 [Peptococcaceae bacterium]
MRKPANYEETQARTGESRQLPAGLYACQIVMAIEEERNGSRLLAIAFDIAEGEYKGFFQQRYDADTNPQKKWPGAGIRRQFVEDRDGSCNPFFKGLITSIEESNPGFKWNWDENTLRGKKFGAIMGREEFLANDGQKKMATKVFYISSIEGLKNAKIPEDKLLPDNTAGYPEMESLPPAGPTPTDADMPFNW